MEENRRFKAKIAGKEYTIVGNKPVTHLNEVVKLVNHQLDQLSALAPELTYSDLSILMAVNAISDQLMKEGQLVAIEAELAQVKAELAKLQANQPTASAQTRNQSNQSVERSTHTSSNGHKIPFQRERR